MENQYSRVVPWDGNLVALGAIGETLELRPYFEWRGLGFISHSALKVSVKYAALDAELHASAAGVAHPITDVTLAGIKQARDRLQHTENVGTAR